MIGAKIVKWIAERTGVRIGNSIGAKIVKLTGRWIAVKIDNRIELCRWTVLIVQTDRIDQSDQTDQIDPDRTNSCGKAMQIEERGQASARRAPAPNCTFLRHVSLQTTSPDMIGV